MGKDRLDHSSCSSGSQYRAWDEASQASDSAISGTLPPAPTLPQASAFSIPSLWGLVNPQAKMAPEKTFLNVSYPVLIKKAEIFHVIATKSLCCKKWAHSWRETRGEAVYKEQFTEHISVSSGPFHRPSFWYPFTQDVPRKPIGENGERWDDLCSHKGMRQKLHEDLWHTSFSCFHHLQRFKQTV